jgi:hypothetical protein
MPPTANEHRPTIHVVLASSPVITAGRVSAVNLITATRIHRVPVQRLGFTLSRAPDWFARKFDEQGLERQFKTLNFLHTARWVRLGRFRHFVAHQPRERLSPRWVLFTANFNGDWAPYFGAFMEAMAEGVYDIWGQSIDYPGFPAPDTANELRDWLATRLPSTQHYYAAYPHATTNDVRSAARVRRDVCSLAIDLQTRQGAARDEIAVTRAFDDVTRGVRHCLGPIDPPWPALVAPSTVLDGTIRGVVAVFPVLPDHEVALRADLEALPVCVESPFRKVPGTHFARLALLHRSEVGRHPKTQLSLRNSYLLFAADYDGHGPTRTSTEHYFRMLYRTIPDDARAVWRHCAGFEYADTDGEFAELATRGRCPVLREFVDYPEESLRSVLTALGSQRRFVELVQRRSSGGMIDAQDVLEFLSHPPSG